MATAAHPKRASLPLPGGSDGAGVAVHPLRTAEMLTQPRFFERPSGPLATLRGLGPATPKSKWTYVPMPCFLVEHPTRGRLPDRHRAAARGLATTCAPRSGGARRSSTTSAMEDGWAVTDQLRGLGLDPLGIELVVMTHLHYDHAGAVAQLPRATFVVDAARVGGRARRRLPAGLPPRSSSTTPTTGARSTSTPAVDSFASFGRAIDLFGDGSVRLLSTPGHTKGHMSVLLRLRAGRELLLTGDAAYARRTIDEELVPLFCDDVHRYRRSLREIRRYLELTPERPGGLRPRRRVLAGGPRALRMRSAAQPLGGGRGWEPSMPSMRRLALAAVVLAALARRARRARARRARRQPATAPPR